MLSRVLVAVVGIPLLLVVLLFFPPVCLPVILGVLCAIAVYEAERSTGEVKHKRLMISSMVLACFVPMWYYFGAGITAGLCALFLFLLAVCVCAMSSNQTITFGQMGICFFCGLVIPLMLSTFVLMNDLPNGKVFLMMPFVASFCSDAFALFAGMAFGKHKLAPRLSPKKTVEGAFGGLGGSVVGCAIFGGVMWLVWGYVPNIPMLMLYGLLASMVSQLGDLSFSYIKRESGIKDYGNLIPGHGGVLDRFDSVIFCAPFTYIMVTLLPFFQFQ